MNVWFFLKIWFFDTEIMWYESQHTMYLEMETWKFDMGYSKTRWGYSLKATIKIKTSPKHLQWILRVATFLTQGGLTLNDDLFLLTRIKELLLSALWNPGLTSKVRCYMVSTGVI